MGMAKPPMRDSTVSASANFNEDEVAKLLAMLEKHDVTEFQIERGGDKLSLKRGAVSQVNYVMQAAAPQHSYDMIAPAVAHAHALPPSSPAASIAAAGAGALVLPAGKKAHEVKSPMVGTFYRRPAVDAEPYAQVGDMVRKGDVLCIIEAMKIMNEIEADTSGKVVELCIEDGAMVEYAEVLYRIEQ